MNASLKRSTPEDLALLAALGGWRLRARVERELDRRAAGALVRRLLGAAARARRAAPVPVPAGAVLVA